MNSYSCREFGPNLEVYSMGCSCLPSLLSLTSLSDSTAYELLNYFLPARVLLRVPALP